MRNFATLSQDNYAIVKQRNVSLFSARIKIASDESKFFICVLKSGVRYSSPKSGGNGLAPEGAGYGSSFLTLNGFREIQQGHLSNGSR